MTEIKLIKSPFKIGNHPFNDAEIVKQVANFYQSVPFYQPTPLINLKQYAKKNNMVDFIFLFSFFNISKCMTVD